MEDAFLNTHVRHACLLEVQGTGLVAALLCLPASAGCSGGGSTGPACSLVAVLKGHCEWSAALTFSCSNGLRRGSSVCMRVNSMLHLSLCCLYASPDLHRRSACPLDGSASRCSIDEE
jgi:hypothetical protein